VAHRDWWIGIGIVAFAIIVHACLTTVEWWSRGDIPLFEIDAATAGLRADQLEGQSSPPRAQAPPSHALGGRADRIAATAAIVPGTSVRTAGNIDRSDPAAAGAETAAGWMGGTASACTIRQSTRSLSETAIDHRSRPALGRLRVDNETGSDAVAVLVADPDGAPRRAIFIHTGEIGVIASVPVGRYHLRFQLGSGWGRERHFCQSSGTPEFDEPFDFSEIDSDAGTRYATYEVTLHPVVAGTAHADAPSDSELDPPPL
jgi:hypothetical protein